MNGYSDYFKKCLEDGDLLFPIYCNDAEVFDYRPGRFSEEAPTHSQGEWVRLNELINAIKSEFSIKWVSPSDALETNKKRDFPEALKLTSASSPIPVKKQTKYNVLRWANTGRADTWLNTMCYRIERSYSVSKDFNNTILDKFFEKKYDLNTKKIDLKILKDPYILKKL